MSIEALRSVTYGDRLAGSRQIGAYDVLRVLLVLAEHAGPDGAGACPSQTTIADEIDGLDRRDVRNAIAALVSQGRIVKTADAVPRVRGDTYTIVCDSNDELGRADPATELGRGIPATVNGTRAGNSGGELGRGTRAGDPRHEPEPEPENPPTPLCTEDLVSALMTDEDLMLISNERTREIIAEMTGRRNGEHVRPLYPPIDLAAERQGADAEPYTFAHLTPARRRKRAE